MRHLRSLFLFLCAFMATSAFAQNTSFTALATNDAGSPVAGGMLTFTLKNCGSSSVPIQNPIDTVISNSSGLVTTILPQNGTFTCAGVDFYQVNLKDASGHLLWSRNYSFKTTTSNLSTPLLILPAPAPISPGGGTGPGGGVASFSAPVIDWPSWLTPSIVNPTSNPELHVLASLIPNGALQNPSIMVNGVPCVLGDACTISSSGAPAVCADTSGSGTAQSCTTSPTFVPGPGSVIVYTTTTPNAETALTLNVNGSGAKPVAKWQTTTILTPGDVAANTRVLMTYDGTNWELSVVGNNPTSQTIPVSIYSMGGGECFISDSTGLGNGSFSDGTGNMIYADYNNVGCIGHEFPGSWYSNAGGPTNTGNSTIPDTFAIQLYPNENPPDNGSFDYYNENGLGSVFNCTSAIGWGYETYCIPTETAGLTAGLMWEGTTVHGKYLAANFTPGGSGTITPFNPASPGDAPFRSGVAACGTVGATFTQQTMPSSGAMYLAWYVINNGTDTANLAIDGTNVGTLSSGAAGSYGTTHESSLWWGQRFALPGSVSTTHTAVITVTAGSFCPIFMITPNPSSWNGMQLPNVYQSLMPPDTTAYSTTAAAIKAMQLSVVTQMAADGLHITPVDLFANWPESGGSTQWCEHNGPGCTYPNGLSSTASATPHYTNLGNTFNAEAFLQASGRTPVMKGGVNSFKGRQGVVNPQAGDYTAAQVTNAADKSTSNTFNGTQTFVSPNPTSPASIDQGSSVPLTMSLAGYIFGPNHDGVPYTVTVGHTLIVAFIHTGSNMTSYSDSLGNSWTHIYAGSDGFYYSYDVWGTIATVGGPDSSMNPFGNVPGAVYDLVNGSLTIDQIAINTTTSWAGSQSLSVSTTATGDILLAGLVGGPNCTIVDNPSFTDFSGAEGGWNGLEFSVNPTPVTVGTYSDTWGGISCGASSHTGSFLIALKAATGTVTQTGPIHLNKSPGGPVLSEVNAQGQFEPPSVAGMPTNNPWPGAQAWNSTLGCLAVYSGSAWACPSGSSFTLGGDLSGSSGSQTVIGIKGISVPTLASGYLHYNGAAFSWDTPSGSGGMTWPSGSSAGIMTYNGSSGYGALYNAANLIPLNFMASGTPGAGKYVDGGTQAWTALPSGGGSGGSVNSSSPTTSFSITGGVTFDATCPSLPCTGTLPSSVSTGFNAAVINKGAVAVTIASGGPAYDGVTNLPPGVGLVLYTDGTGFHSSMPITHYLGCTYTPALTGGTVDCSGLGGGGSGWAASSLTAPPACSAFTWVNQGSASCAVSSSLPIITMPYTSSLNWRIESQSNAYSTPYKVAAAYSSTQTADSSEVTGLYLTDGTKLLGFELLSQGSATLTLRIEELTNVTTDSSSAKTQSLVYSSGIPLPMGSTLYLRWRNDGTNLYADYSADGIMWVNFYSQTVGAWLTPTAYGWGGLDEANVGSDQYFIELKGWQVSNDATF